MPLKTPFNANKVVSYGCNHILKSHKPAAYTSFQALTLIPFLINAFFTSPLISFLLLNLSSNLLASSSSTTSTPPLPGVPPKLPPAAPNLELLGVKNPPLPGAPIALLDGVPVGVPCLLLSLKSSSFSFRTCISSMSISPLLRSTIPVILVIVF